MRAIFLDRDGVICKNRHDYVKNWAEFEFLPGVQVSLAALSHLGLPIIVVTNQSIIGRRIVPARVVDDIHQRMMAEVAAYGGRIDRVIYCPHRPEDKCRCRKPEPGMLLQVAEEMDINLAQSYLVGDAATDLVAGNSVGCRTFLVLTGRGFQQLLPTLGSMGSNFTIVRNLMEATSQILRDELSITDEADGWGLTYDGRYRRLLSTTGNL
jgi:D-glycero-D-manno-heptose 1,7-bisphosphate phosphatase